MARTTGHTRKTVRQSVHALPDNVPEVAEPAKSHLLKYCCSLNQATEFRFSLCSWPVGSEAAARGPQAAPVVISGARHAAQAALAMESLPPSYIQLGLTSDMCVCLSRHYERRAVVVHSE